MTRPEQSLIHRSGRRRFGRLRKCPDFHDGPLPVPEAEAVEIVKVAIFNSLTICAYYMAEIDAAIEFVCGREPETIVHNLVQLVCHSAQVTAMRPVGICDDRETKSPTIGPNSIQLLTAYASLCQNCNVSPSV